MQILRCAQDDSVRMVTELSLVQILRYAQDDSVRQILRYAQDDGLRSVSSIIPRWPGVARSAGGGLKRDHHHHINAPTPTTITPININT